MHITKQWGSAACSLSMHHEKPIVVPAWGGLALFPVGGGERRQWG